MLAHDSIKLDLPLYAQRALDVLEQNGYSAYVVGGWVRDAVMGKNAHDIDISTSALWQEVSSCFTEAGYSVYETGIQHGTVSVNIDDHIIEITTFREESGYQDSRHPDAVQFVDSINDDLKRRDFTINAMAYNPREGLIDLFGGLQDITSMTLRCVGDPSVRFDEDALRILRAVRFSSRLGFALDPATSDALNASVHKLSSIADERIGAELSAIVSSGKLSYAMRNFPNVMCQAIPQLSDMVDFDQKSQYHAYNCMEHTIRVVEGVETTTGSQGLDALRWAAFWHDIAKPQCMYVDSMGQGHFPDHPDVSAHIAREAMRKMALPSDLITTTYALIREHDEPIAPTKQSMVRMLQRLLASGIKKDDVYPVGFAAIYIRQADALAKAFEYRSYVSELESCKAALQDVMHRGVPLTTSDLKITGKDVLNTGHLESGPIVGKILKCCLEEVIQGHLTNERESQLEWLSNCYKKVV